MARIRPGPYPFRIYILAINHLESIFCRQWPRVTHSFQIFYRQNTKFIFPAGYPCGSDPADRRGNYRVREVRLTVPEPELRMQQGFDGRINLPQTGVVINACWDSRPPFHSVVPRVYEGEAGEVTPEMALFCRTRTTTRRFSACPSCVFSLPTCSLSPIAPGASILVRGTWPC